MATATFKSVVMMRAITEGLKRRLPTYVFTSQLEATTGNPLLLVSSDSSPATTKQVALIRVSPVQTVMLNGLDSTQQPFTPHFVELALEAGTGTGLTASTYLSLVNSTAIMGELMKQTGLLVTYLTANGTVPAIGSSATQMVAANQVGSFTTDASWLLAGS